MKPQCTLVLYVLGKAAGIAKEHSTLFQFRSAKHYGNIPTGTPPLTGAQNPGMYEKYRDDRPISRFISEIGNNTRQGHSYMERQQELVYDILNGVISNDLELPLTQISKSLFDAEYVRNCTNRQQRHDLAYEVGKWHRAVPLLCGFNVPIKGLTT